MASNNSKIYNEIYIKDESPVIAPLVQSLTQEERTFIYYMTRALKPFNRIYRDQSHRSNNIVIHLFEHLYQQCLDPKIKVELETYLVYLWTNHGIYYHRDHSKKCVTKVTSLTKDQLRTLIQESKFNDDCICHPDFIENLLALICDPEVDATFVVDSSIEKSCNNYYGKGFTEEDYKTFPAEVTSRINAYFYKDNGVPCVIYHGINGKYSDELKESVSWLQKALEHAKQHPCFDSHTVRSLQLLIEYFETGDEEKFREHCIEWLQCTSRVGYTLGFVENYEDPKGIRGHAGGDITVRTVDMEKIQPILLQIEDSLPVDPEFKRTNKNNTKMNVSIARLVYGTGDYGPTVQTAAYCLPNYEDIREKYGSRQIIYKTPESIDRLLNPELSREMVSYQRRKFNTKYDPKEELFDDLWNVQVLLHETLGHASGKLYQHTFVADDLTFTIGGKTYQVGDTIGVTASNLAEFISMDQSSLEELRAEINALYISLHEMDILNQYGLFKDWVTKLGKDRLRKQIICEMCMHMFRRYSTQPKDMTTIKGAHARANVTISNFLLESGAIKIIDDARTDIVDGETLHFVDVQVVDSYLAFQKIKELVRLIQRIKSTGDGIGCKRLFEKYTQYPVTIEDAKKYRQYRVTNREKLIGKITSTAIIYPEYQPTGCAGCTGSNEPIIERLRKQLSDS